jgi:sortase A
MVAPPLVRSSPTARPVAALPASVAPTSTSGTNDADASVPAAEDSNLEAAIVPQAPPPALGEPSITRIMVNSIKLDTEVVPAPYSEADGGTWEIPKFKPGHAEYTAGAGQPGNAVLFGHVTSISSGDVFLHLDRVKLGDVVKVYSADDEFDYRVVEVRPVDRDDVGVLYPTPNPSISLITCTGDWLPLARDYSERLVVRAELVGPSSTTA